MSTWVLLRGLMRESRHWGGFPKLFEKQAGAANVVTLDLPGNGALHTHTSATSIAAMAAYCREYLGKSGYAPPFRLLALSLGGMVAAAWSELAPHEIERMVLINTSLKPFSPFYHRLRPGNYPALIRFLLFGSAAQRERLILLITSNVASQSNDWEAILDSWLGYAREFPVSPANILRQLMAAGRYRATLAKPPVPVLLLASRNDRLVNVKSSLALAKSWNCPVRIHPHAGHDLPLDDGEWVSQQVAAWLTESGQQ
jgi:pimeloyl-ACP methyl ester carboxylesterase